MGASARLRIHSVTAASIVSLALALVVPAVAAAAAPLVVIDPGHGGPYSNANANGLKEKNVNLSIALELRRQLLAKGYRVSMTRTTDRAVVYGDIRTWNWSESAKRWRYSADGHKGYYGGIPKDDLQGRVNVANRLGADVFISIHNNGSADRSVRGTETYASPRDSLGRSLAPLVHKRILARTGLRDRGSHTSDFYVCRWANMPAILVEGAFISNAKDASLLKQATFRAKIARGIVEGLDAWFAGKPVTTTARPVRSGSAASAAVAASKLKFPTGATTVVLARSDRWSDAPAAPALAARLKAPLLWVGANGPSNATLEELGRLNPHKLVTVGVSGSFDSTMTSAIASASVLPTSAVNALSAKSRAELAVSIAASMGPAASGALLVVDDKDTWSMRAAAPISASQGIPILMTSSGRLPARAWSLRAATKGVATSTLLVGSSTVLPSGAVSGLPSVKRYDGKFSEKAGRLNGRYFPTTSTRTLSAVVADQSSGAGYLTAARYAASGKRPVLPVDGKLMSGYTRLWISNRRPQLAKYEVFDYSRTVPWSVEHMLRKADRE